MPSLSQLPAQVLLEKKETLGLPIHGTMTRSMLQSNSNLSNYYHQKVRKGIFKKADSGALIGSSSITKSPSKLKQESFQGVRANVATVPLIGRIISFLTVGFSHAEENYPTFE